MGKKRPKDYDAIEIEQQPGAPRMYVFGAPAAEILLWADVPESKQEYMAGYQRVYNEDRAHDLTAFLEKDVRNILPGAVIIAVNAQNLEVRKEGSFATLTIRSTALPFDQALKDLHDSFYKRLSEAERKSLDEIDVEKTTLQQEEESPAPPESYLALLTAELKEALKDFASIPEDRQIAIEEYVKSVSKPGLIIDGQHRIFGAKDVSKFDVILPVVLIADLPPSEQVFHFYVLNNKAKPLTPLELRRTISTALSNEEIGELWKRFQQAGLNPVAARLTHKINTDPRSPFKDLLDFGLGGGGFLKENVMFQLASKFVFMPKKYRALYKDVVEWQPSAPVDERLNYFYALWAAVRDTYPELWHESVESKAGQFFYKVSLMTLQEYLLDQLMSFNQLFQIEGRPSPLSDQEDLKKYVMSALKALPAEFFTTEWKEKQMDTSDGRDRFRQYINAAISNQGKWINNLGLFKAKAAR